MFTKILFLIFGLYILVGIVLYFINSKKSFIDRPLALSKKGLPNILFFILLSPISIFPRLRKKKHKHIEVNASEEETKLYNLGTIANSQGKYKMAIEYFSRVIKMNPNFSEAYVNRGNAYSRIKNPDVADSIKFINEKINNAISDFDKAVAIDPKNGYAYYNRAVAKWIKGDSNESLLDIKKAKELGFNDIDPEFEKNLRVITEK